MNESVEIVPIQKCYEKQAYEIWRDGTGGELIRAFIRFNLKK